MKFWHLEDANAVAEVVCLRVDRILQLGQPVCHLKALQHFILFYCQISLIEKHEIVEADIVGSLIELKPESDELNFVKLLNLKYTSS